MIVKEKIVFFFFFFPFIAHCIQICAALLADYDQSVQKKYLCAGFTSYLWTWQHPDPHHQVPNQMMNQAQLQVHHHLALRMQMPMRLMATTRSSLRRLVGALGIPFTLHNYIT